MLTSPNKSRLSSNNKKKGIITPKAPKKQPCPDRFIPNRNLTDFDWSEFMLKDNPLLPTPKKSGMASMDCSASLEEYTSTLVDTMYPEQSGKVFSYSQKSLTSPKRYFYSSQKELDIHTPIQSRKKKRRNIPKVPEKILDAPDFIDDYYLNLLDWSSENLLAVALGRTVYIWNAETGDINELLVRIYI